MIPSLTVSVKDMLRKLSFIANGCSIRFGRKGSGLRGSSQKILAATTNPPTATYTHES